MGYGVDQRDENLQTRLGGIYLDPLQVAALQIDQRSAAVGIPAGTRHSAQRRALVFSEVFDARAGTSLAGGRHGRFCAHFAGAELAVDSVRVIPLVPGGGSAGSPASNIRQRLVSAQGGTGREGRHQRQPGAGCHAESGLWAGRVRRAAGDGQPAVRVFFPEKRPFFQENSSYFSTPINLVFTRRIVDPLLRNQAHGQTRAVVNRNAVCR